ncbi:hypothetical protein AK812_SmicGene13205 [Symbiodinium microadriaticum]|uniref:Uncharacterized protein n=1 Tax=Symbiodinium microadriaticum TaxID=2951 RepID=A0A1Q9E8T0_SYMMI|nr:hypothetical protein AK812_SmicGene13205 [Symbiodinium microadriaticum]
MPGRPSIFPLGDPKLLVVKFLESFEFELTEMQDLLTQVVLGASITEVACEWVRSKRSVWQRSNRQCLQGYGLADPVGEQVSTRAQTRTELGGSIYRFTVYEVPGDRKMMFHRWDAQQAWESHALLLEEDYDASAAAPAAAHQLPLPLETPAPAIYATPAGYAA